MAECNHSVQVPLLSKGLAFAGFWTLWFGFENKAWIAPKYPTDLKNNKHVKNTIQCKAAGRSQQRKKLQIIRLYCTFVTWTMGHRWGKASSQFSVWQKRLIQGRLWLTRISTLQVLPQLACMCKWHHWKPPSHDYPRPPEAQLQALPFLPASEEAAPLETLQTNDLWIYLRFFWQQEEKRKSNTRQSKVMSQIPKSPSLFFATVIFSICLLNSHVSYDSQVHFN